MSNFTITDHALIRYFERILGVDLTEIKKKLTAEVGGVAVKLGDGKYPLSEGGQAVVLNNKIVTITK